MPSLHALVLVCDAVSDIDLTGLDALRDLTEHVQRAGIEVRMCRVKGPVHDALLESGLVDLVGAPHFHDSVRAGKEGLGARRPAGRARGRHDRMTFAGGRDVQ